MWNSRPPLASWKKNILNFHFDYLHPSLKAIVLVFDIGFGPPIAESKNLKNYVKSDLNDIF